MKIAPRNSLTSCYGHYCRQAGLGPPDYFGGTRFQRGSGLLSDFRNRAVPFVLPFIKNAALGAGRYILRKGNEFISDLDSGVGFKTAAKQRLGEVKSDFFKNVLGRQGGGSGRWGGIKRKRLSDNLSAPFPFHDNQSGSRRVRGRKPKKKSREPDIFD